MVDTLNLRKLQILGDSKTTIDWVKGLVQIQVPRLKSSLVQICSLFSVLKWFSSAHIYRELNTQASELSKEDLLMDKGVFSFQELYEGKPFEEMVFFLQ
jgi:hypothetical protein